MRNVALLSLAILLIGCGPNSEFIELQTEYSNLESRLVEAQTNIDGLEELIAEQETQLENLASENLDLLGEINTAQLSLRQYENAIEDLVCDRQIDHMSYSSILDASSDLEAYVNGLPGVQRTSGAFRDTIYSNSDSKIHAIRYYDADGNQYIMTFLVYFNEFGWTPSTLL